LAWQHFRIEGIFVAFAFVCHRLLQRVSFSKRDAGERAAERFLRAMGFRILARNWRSPRDPRDEADLIALTPCGEFVVIVEVKRAAGPWDALDRVDGRKREVLWRLLLDLSGRAPPRGPTLSRDRIDRRLARALELAPTARVDLVGVRGEGHGASAVRHVTSILERRVESRVRIKRE
jgi:Holliday junction resolvase-like predicted endonuclease